MLHLSLIYAVKYLLTEFVYTLAVDWIVLQMLPVTPLPSKSHIPHYTHTAQRHRHCTCDSQVAGSIPGRWLSRNVGQLSLASLRDR